MDCMITVQWTVNKENRNNDDHTIAGLLSSLRFSDGDIKLTQIKMKIIMNQSDYLTLAFKYWMLCSNMYQCSKPEL